MDFGSIIELFVLMYLGQVANQLFKIIANINQHKDSFSWKFYFDLSRKLSLGLNGLLIGLIGYVISQSSSVSFLFGDNPDMALRGVQLVSYIASGFAIDFLFRKALKKFLPEGYVKKTTNDE